MAQLHFRIIDNTTGKCVMVMGSDSAINAAYAYEYEAQQLMGGGVRCRFNSGSAPYRLELCR